jgi:SAM-dependent methyltransferase
VGYAAADACRLPFAANSFDSSYCVAVLQHIRDLSGALSELARVTRPSGRVLVVEPDNAARYWFSSVPSGMEAFELSRRFFAGLASAKSESPAVPVGPLVPGMLAAAGVPPTSVRLFPVSVAHLGVPPPAFWDSRRASVRDAIAKAPDEALRRLGADYLKRIDAYARDAAAAGDTFVEIQNTMLFATVGQKAE